MVRYFLLAIVVCVVFPGTDLVAQPKVRVACVGDSITEGTYGNVYPTILAELLGDKHDVKNYGVGAATLLSSGAKPYIMQPMFRKAVEFRPNIVIIMLGTNDSTMEGWRNSANFVKDYSNLINTFKKADPKVQVYLCTPPPVMTDNWGIRGAVVGKEVCKKVVETGKEVKVVKVIDIFAAFEDKNNLHQDGVHPNAEGAKLIAELVHKAIKSRKPEK